MLRINTNGIELHKLVMSKRLPQDNGSSFRISMELSIAVVCLHRKTAAIDYPIECRNDVSTVLLPQADDTDTSTISRRHRNTAHAEYRLRRNPQQNNSRSPLHSAKLILNV